MQAIVYNEGTAAEALSVKSGGAEQIVPRHQNQRG